MEVLFLIFKGSSILFSIIALPIYITTSDWSSDVCSSDLDGLPSLYSSSLISTPGYLTTDWNGSVLALLCWDNCCLYLLQHRVWRRQWHPTPVLLPQKSHGRRGLVGCSPWGRQVGYNWVASLSLFTFMHWRRQWQPTPVFLPGESQGWGSLVGCCLWGCTASDTTEET